MNDTTKRDGRVIHPRLPDELHARLAAFASRTHRSLNGATVALLERALTSAEQPGRPGEPDLHLR
ncbi:MAG: hypothetical protein JNM77_08710 [Pseudonocardia sp.]|nr:hypothetical protein [Pseudonocardia sp.]